MKLLFDTGTEKWVRWAKHKLALLTGARKLLKLPRMVKVLAPESGTYVHLVSSDWGDMIRITGGVVGRISVLTSDNVYNAYMFSGALTEYGVAELDSISGSSSRPVLSWNGYTYVSVKDTSPSAVLQISRRHRTTQEITLATELINFSPLDTYDHQTNVKDPLESAAARNPSYWTSQDGKYVVAVGLNIFPHIYKLDSAQEAQESQPEAEWTGATDFDLVLSGEPSFCTTIHDAAALENYQYRYYNNKTRRNIVITRTHFDSGVSYNALITSLDVGMQLHPVYDYFDDRLLVKLDYLRLNRLETQATSNGLMIYIYLDRVRVLYSLDYTTLAWTEIDRREILEAEFQNWEETTGGGFNGLTSTTTTLDGLSVRYNASSSNNFRLDDDNTFSATYVAIESAGRARLVWFVPNLERTVTDPPTSSGTLSLTADNLLLKDSSGTIATLPGITSTAVSAFAALLALSSGGVLYGRTGDIKWHDIASSTTVTLTDHTGEVYMSASGRQLWVVDHSTAASAKFYANGELKKSYGSIPSPTADYTEVPDDGFYFIDYSSRYISGDNITWSHDREVFKARVYTHTEDVTGGLGLLYSWVTADKLLQYDAATDTFRTIKTYSGTQSVKEDPADANSASLSISNVNIVEDEFLSR